MRHLVLTPYLVCKTQDTHQVLSIRMSEAVVLASKKLRPTCPAVGTSHQATDEQCNCWSGHLPQTVFKQHSIPSTRADKARPRPRPALIMSQHALTSPPASCSCVLVPMPCQHRISKKGSARRPVGPLPEIHSSSPADRNRPPATPPLLCCYAVR